MAGGFAVVGGVPAARRLLFRSFFKCHFISIAAVCCLVAVVSAALCTLAAVSQNTRRYVAAEIERSGYGDVAFWVSGLDSADALADSVSRLERVERAECEPLIFADYKLNQKESDSEGQLLLYQNDGRYRFFSLDSRGRVSGFAEAPAEIAAGSAYLPASMMQGFGAKVGDRIHIVTARNGARHPLLVAGFFEDPVAGSTMIGMKRFLIGADDYAMICAAAERSGIDALARKGFLLHLWQKDGADGTRLSDADFIKYVNENSALPRFAEQAHSRTVMAGFMLLLQDSFTAIFASFVLVLLFVTLLVLVHTVRSDIRADWKDLGILKELGFTSRGIAGVFCRLFALPVFFGAAAGLAVCYPLSSLTLSLLVTSSGLLVPARVPLALCLPALSGIAALLLCAAAWSARAVGRFSPLAAICGAEPDEKKTRSRTRRNALHQHGFQLHLALRQVLSKKSAYAGVLAVSFFLALFSSMTARLDSWLGRNGEGLMDAFNPADHHLGVQGFGSATVEDFERVIENYSEITGRYVIAMPVLRLNGTDCKANVISAPEQFHILRGRTCGADEVLLTEFLLADLGLSLGDSVEISSRSGSARFVISGTYQCANDMGANFGMSRDGYLRIADDNPSIWCHHYFLRDEKKRLEAMGALEEAYGAEIHVHENAWPGLYSILAAMRTLIAALYALSALFVLLSVLLSARKVRTEETRDLATYRLMGYRSGTLRLSFALRFMLVSAAGAMAALVTGGFLTDPLAGMLLRSAGIAGFSSHPGAAQALLPALFVICVAGASAWVLGGLRGSRGRAERQAFLEKFRLGEHKISV